MKLVDHVLDNGCYLPKEAAYRIALFVRSESAATSPLVALELPVKWQHKKDGSGHRWFVEDAYGKEISGHDVVAALNSAAVSERAIKPCHWMQDSDGIYHTGCGEAFTFDSGTAKENKAKFCQYCGSDLIAKEHEDEPAQ